MNKRIIAAIGEAIIIGICVGYGSGNPFYGVAAGVTYSGIVQELVVIKIHIQRIRNQGQEDK